MNIKVWNEQGGVLVMVLMMSLVMMVLGVTVFYITNTELSESGQRGREIKAFHLAESGIEHSMFWLARQSQPPANIESFDPLGGTQILGDGTYAITMVPDPSNSDQVLKNYSITSVGRTDVEQVEKQIEIDVRQESFAKFGLFFDQSLIYSGGTWKNVYFTDTDTVRGPCHGNDYIRFYGDAHFFQGKVTSTKCNFVYYNGDENPYFEQGYQLGVDPVVLPSDTERLKAKAAEGGLNLNGQTSIRLNPNGTMDIRNPQIMGDDGTLGHLKKNHPLPGNGVLHVAGGDIDSLSGILDGALTISCANDIYVTGHIDYEDDPRVDPESEDVLGLVAKNKIRIPLGTPDDLRLCASLMALNAIEVVNYDSRPRQGHLLTLGGWIVKYLYATERYSGSTPVSGYGTSTTYDERLANYPPPWFPTLGTYSVVAWRDI